MKDIPNANGTDENRTERAQTTKNKLWETKMAGVHQRTSKKNITLDDEDLKEFPIFIDRCGLSKFKKVFAEEYEKIINEINSAITA